MPKKIGSMVPDSYVRSRRKVIDLADFVGLLYGTDPSGKDVFFVKEERHVDTESVICDWFRSEDPRQFEYLHNFNKEEIVMKVTDLVTDKTIMDKAKDVAMGAVATGKDELGSAVWRSAARQSLKRTNGLIIKSLKAKKMPGPAIKWLEGFLETEVGLATYGVIAGTLLSLAPRVNARPRWMRLASEMRIYGFDGLINCVVDPLLDVLEGAIEEALTSVPEDT